MGSPDRGASTPQDTRQIGRSLISKPIISAWEIFFLLSPVHNGAHDKFPSHIFFCFNGVKCHSSLQNTKFSATFFEGPPSAGNIKQFCRGFFSPSTFDSTGQWIPKWDLIYWHTQKTRKSTGHYVWFAWATRRNACAFGAFSVLRGCGLQE